MIKSFGQRVRYARIESGLSQSELAKRVSHITKTRTSKSLVSRWELDKVANPQNVTMMAVSAVTGFSMRWLCEGKGPERGGQTPVADDPAGRYGRGITRDTLRVGIIVACAEHKDPIAIAEAAIEVVETLADDPGLPRSVLHRIARLAAVPAIAG